MAMPTDDIDGVWTGHYTHHGRRCGITARFAPVGDRLRGGMTDAVTVFENSLDELREMEDWSDEQAASVAESLYASVPEADGEPIAAVVRLPAASEIDGYVQGAVVRFRKTYLGRQVFEWRVGPYALGQELPPHSVEYEGELSADGRRIAGRWWIDPDPAAGTGGAEGRFELRRG